MFGFVGLAWAAGFLGVATRAAHAHVQALDGLPADRRRRRASASACWCAQIGTAGLVNEFLDGPRTVEDATLQPPTAAACSRARCTLLGSLLLAVGLVLVSLNAMRAGLLTRLFGYIGIAAGALLVLFPLPIVQVFWLGGLGMLLLGRWPGGDFPAWRTGNAEPWPCRERRARGVGRTGSGQRSGRAAGRAASERSVTRRGGDRMATEGQTLEQQLEELLDQETFPPPDGLQGPGGRLRPDHLRAGRGLRGVLGRARRGAALGHQVGPGPRLVEPAVREVVRRRQAQRRLQLRRPPRRGRQRRPRRLPLAR